MKPSLKVNFYHAKNRLEKWLVNVQNYIFEPFSKQLFPAHDLILSALCKGTNNTKTTNKNRKQPVLKVVDWQNLTKLSQVKDNVLSALYPYSHPIQCIFHYAISLVFLAKIIYIYLQFSLSTRFLGTKSSPWLASSSSWLTGLWALPCLLQATPWLPKSPTVSPIAENHFMYLLWQLLESETQQWIMTSGQRRGNQLPPLYTV